MESIQIISVATVFLASIIPIYFAIKVRTNNHILLLSTLLSLALLAYGIHGIVESLESNYGLIFEICFLVGVLGTIISYAIFQKSKSHGLGGAFGLAMLSVFGIWLIGEVMETFLPVFNTIAVYLSSITMIGFGIFVFVRFFRLRQALELEYRMES
jgi:hypothetical protein